MNLPDFDELVALAKSDPEALEQLRREMVEQVIESASDENTQRRLRGLQFRIDAKIRQSRTPMAACITLSRMMHDSLFELRDSLMGQHPRHECAREPASVLSMEVARSRRTLQ